LTRVPTVGTDPAFVRMIRDLVVERQTPGAPRPALGDLGASHDVCPAYCCWYEPAAGRPTSASDVASS
jgi:ferrochelatase